MINLFKNPLTWIILLGLFLVVFPSIPGSIVGISVKPIREGEDATINFRWQEYFRECQNSGYAIFMDGEKLGVWCGTPSGEKTIVIKNPTAGEHQIIACGSCFDDRYYERYGNPCEHEQVSKGASWDLTSLENCMSVKKAETTLYVIPTTETTLTSSTISPMTGEATKPPDIPKKSLDDILNGVFSSIVNWIKEVLKW